MENECIKGKVRTVSQLPEILASQENLIKEIEEIRINLAAKVAKIVHLKMQNKKLSSKGLGP